MLTVVPGAADADDPRRPDSAVLIDELVREGARRMQAEALQAEVDVYIAAFVDERDEAVGGWWCATAPTGPARSSPSAGAVEVTVSRVNDRRVDPDTGARQRFASAILPPWCRKTPKITEVMPLLYLRGLSTGDVVPALGQFLGSSAGLSGPVIAKLTKTWKAERHAFSKRICRRSTTSTCGSTGSTVNFRLDEHELCLLVMIGVRADGRKELVTLADGYRESTERSRTPARRRGVARVRTGG